MARATAAARHCSICGAASKYRSPQTQAPYCSVACFKVLNAREVEGKPCLQGDDKSPPRNREETALQALPQENDPEARDRLVHKDGVSEVQEPTVRLRDLKWPEEPDPSIWQDPLRRDELKPMRQYELQAIAENSELRQMLTVDSLLPQLLEGIFSDFDAQPIDGLKRLMAIEGANTQAIPATGLEERGRGRARGRVWSHRGRGRGRGRGGGGFSPHSASDGASSRPSAEALQTMQKFANIVRDVLSTIRSDSLS